MTLDMAKPLIKNALKKQNAKSIIVSLDENDEVQFNAYDSDINKYVETTQERIITLTKEIERLNNK